MNPIRARVPDLESKVAYYEESWYNCRKCGCKWNGTWAGSWYSRSTVGETGGWCKTCAELRQSDSSVNCLIYFKDDELVIKVP